MCSESPPPLRVIFSNNFLFLDFPSEEGHHTENILHKILYKKDSHPPSY